MIRRSPRQSGKKENLNNSLTEIEWLHSLGAEGHECLATPKREPLSPKVIESTNIMRKEPTPGKPSVAPTKPSQPIAPVSAAAPATNPSAARRSPPVKQLYASALPRSNQGPQIQRLNMSTLGPVAAAPKPSAPAAVPSLPLCHTIPEVSLRFQTSATGAQTVPMLGPLPVVPPLQSNMFNHSQQYSVGFNHQFNQSSYASTENPNEKPAYSYAALITAAINAQPTGRLTLSGIYDWILEHFPFFRNANKGWKVC